MYKERGKQMDFRKKVILFIFACIAFSPIYNVVADTGSFTSIAGIVYKLQRNGSYGPEHATTYKENRVNYSACSAIGVPYSGYSTSSCAYLATTHATWWSIIDLTPHMHLYEGIPGIALEPGEVLDGLYHVYTFPLQ